MVLNQEISLDGEHLVKLPLINALNVTILDRFKSDLLLHLKSNLDNGNIRLETVLIEADHTKMIYTNSEKFEHLARKKPIINQLKDRLGLDPDF